MTKVVIVGSSDIALPSFSLPAAIVSSILAIVSTLPQEAEVAVRGPKWNPPLGSLTMRDKDFASAIEMWTWSIAGKMGRRPVVYRPDGSGRESVFKRDYDLVEGADHVYAYFAPDKIMEGGTGHIVKAALDRNIPVEAWTIDLADDGQLMLVGSDDGKPPSSPDELSDLWILRVIQDDPPHDPTYTERR